LEVNFSGHCEFCDFRKPAAILAVSGRQFCIALHMFIVSLQLIQFFNQNLLFFAEHYVFSMPRNKCKIIKNK